MIFGFTRISFLYVVSYTFQILSPGSFIGVESRFISPRRYDDLPSDPMMTLFLDTHIWDYVESVQFPIVKKC